MKNEEVRRIIKSFCRPIANGVSDKHLDKILDIIFTGMPEDNFKSINLSGSKKVKINNSSLGN